MELIVIPTSKGLEIKWDYTYRALRKTPSDLQHSRRSTNDDDDDGTQYLVGQRNLKCLVLLIVRIGVDYRVSVDYIILYCVYIIYRKVSLRARDYGLGDVHGWTCRGSVMLLKL